MPESAGSREKLTAKQEKALIALLTEPSVSAAARKVGIAERTLFGWLQNDAFDAAYRQARRDALQQAISRLQQVSSAAVTVLLSIMADKTVPPGVRLRAAEKVLDLAFRAVELEDVQARLAALESLFKRGV